MMNLILAPLGILLMILGVTGLFVALRGPAYFRERLASRGRRPKEDAAASDDE